jgi:hypothetical protein
MFATILAGLILVLAGSSARADGGKAAPCGAAEGDGAATPVAVTPLSEVVERWGVEIVSLRLTAEGNMIDLRYRIVDPDKAAFLVDRTNKAYLLDQESGRAVGVPNTAKVGPLRQTTKYGKPPADRVFFMLFANPGRMIESGSRMTLAVGDFRVEDLVLI